jgi:gluconolactonase
LDAKRSALIIQDLQNDVITEGGAFADSGAPAHAKSQSIVENVKRLAEAARVAGMPVIHVHYIVEHGAPGLKQNAPLFVGVKESNALVRGTWGAAPVDGLEPQSGDHLVEKMRMNGFYNTRLDILLRGLGADTIVITGAWTNMSIEHTARHGADAGYEVVVVSDGTSTTGEDWHNAALNYAMTNVGRVASTSEVVNALGALAAA